MNNSHAKFKESVAKAVAAMLKLSRQMHRANEALDDLNFSRSVASQSDESVRAMEIAESLIARTNKKVV